jgi:hypothetical protein
MLLKRIISVKRAVIEVKKKEKENTVAGCTFSLCIVFFFMHKMGRKLKKYHKAMSVKIYFT